MFFCFVSGDTVLIHYLTITFFSGRLTDTRVMVHYGKYLITSAFHVVVGANASKHWGQSKVRPGFMAHIPVEIENMNLLYSLSQILCFE